MRNRTLLTTVAGILSLLASIPTSASAQNRLPQAIPANSQRVAISGTLSKRVFASTDLGAAASDRPLQSLSLRFSMTPAQSAALTQLLANQQNPSSPQYHQWLTPAQFGAEFGLSSADLATVTGWLQSQGFTVTGVANGRQFVTFTGTVGQVNQAFGVSIHNVSYQGEQHVAALTEASLPAPLANVVADVTGLNDFHPRARIKRRVVPANAQYAGANSYGNLIAPGDFYTIYNESSLLNAATPINGSGVTIGVMGQVDVYTQDLTAFRTAAGLSTSNLPTTVTEGPSPGQPTIAECESTSPPTSCGDLDESSLDLEWSGAVAPAASILFVTGEDVFADSMTQAIDQNLAPILTVSYGGCESQFDYGSVTTGSLNALFEQANAQGQTVLGPAGDSGATDCDDSGVTYASNGLAVDFPASSPYVTAVGGTEFDEGGGTYWGTTNGTNGGTALSYIPEQPWNEFYEVYGGVFEGLDDGGGGGGVSILFSKPSWQTGNGVPADSSRDVPDVAYSASANHDPYLVCVLELCTNGGFSYTDTGGTEYNVFGGTSVATPEFAATLALVEQKTGARLGNVNPTIYGLANSSYASTVFHAKTSGGTNAAPCTAGTLDCNVGYPNFFAGNTLACPANSNDCTGDISIPAIGYVAASGNTYDLATGWGSVNIANFVTDFPLATPTGTSGATLTASSVSVTSGSASLTAGATETITATVTPSAATGTVQLLVDNVAEGSPVTLSGGTATLTYATPSTFPSGQHIFAVSYSGNATYAGSVGMVSVDATSPSAGDFSISPTSPTVTVASGGTSSPLTFTVGSLNGFAGTVTLNISSFSSSTFDDDSVECFSTTAAPSCTASSVAVTGTTPGTFTLTIYAYYNSTTGLFKKHQAAVHLPPAPSPWVLGGTSVTLAGLIFFGLPRRRRRWSALLVAIVSVGILSVAGCTGASGPANSNNGNINAPAGTSTFTITASGTNSAGTAITHTDVVTVTVQ
jgi:subtilase family serine protease